MPKRKYQTPEILHDAPLTDQKAADFHFDDFAATLARLIASPGTETPLAIGINGAWGSGKTSLLLRVKNMLDKPNGEDGKGEHRFAEVSEKFRTCKAVWFDAWKYSGEDQILAALLRVIVAEMQRDGFWNWLKAQSQAKKEDLKWFDLLADSLLQFASAGVYSLNLGDYRVDTPLKQASAFFDYFDDSLNKLLATWVGGKLVSAKQKEIDEKKGVLVVFIDDLDRCMPDKTVQVLEAVKLFLDKQGCIFVLGADIKIVQTAVETHYKNTGITGESAKDYLEKIIQLRFDLPPIVEQAMENYLRSQKIVDKDMLKRWRTLIAAAEVNPRRVKNVINDLNLQWHMAANSGQAEGVNRDDFICWQALIHAAPSAFVRQVTDFEDKSIRYNFIRDALKWQNGKQEDKDAVKGFFSAYEDKDSNRLRKVLRNISFSNEFTMDALDAMIYMTVPPSKPLELSSNELPDLVEVTASSGSEKRGIPDFLREAGWVESDIENQENLPTYAVPRFVGRGETAMPTADQNRRTIGGLEFVRVPQGSFVMGSKDDNPLAYDSEKPQHTVDINYDYWMAKFILTNLYFAEFIKATSYVTTADERGGWHPKQTNFVKGVNWRHPTDVKDKWEDKQDHPVVQVSWDDAMAYCKWFNETFNNELGDLVLRLPTEAEWEKAGRGAYGNEWPWGNEFDANKCNSAEGGKGGTTPVGLYSPQGDSPYGCADMAGNVWEWCNDWYDADEYKKRAKASVVNPRGPKNGGYRVLRGGAFNNSDRGVRCSDRYRYGPYLRSDGSGFRVVVSPFS
ncbi:MAG TPA: SUMF1/EgtB/PvdO family nonheme iron enzyme [Anaerolineales bacterium]|nr:SUMF1/EgtB/PvdO family nonheme iron enzyme [Anaerolineales bacterium]